MPALPAGMRTGRVLLVVALVGLALSVVLTGELATGTGTTSARKPGLPVRLKIPKTKVDAAVEQVGLTADGAMDVPSGPETTGWYDRGPRPGETGSAVIDGHFDLGDGTPAVFDDLHTLQAGDRLYVEDGQGTTTTFVVHESRTYDPEADASSVFRSRDGRAHLNLITCAGDWNKDRQSYSSRLIVFAEKQTQFRLTGFGVISAD